MIIANTPSPFRSESNVYDVNGISPTLTARDYKGPVKVLIKNATKKGYLIAKEGDGIDTAYPESKTRRGRVQKNMAHTLTTDDSKAVIVQRPRGFNKGGTHINSPSITKSSWQENNFLSDNYRIRKLTPKECWRLMGCSDEDFEKAEQVNSNSQLYKQAGNAIVVDVLEAIFSKLFLKQETNEDLR
jgi:DNA (cytosine-5)-methyltransferase 1